MITEKALSAVLLTTSPARSDRQHVVDEPSSQVLSAAELAEYPLGDGAQALDPSTQGGVAAVETVHLIVQLAQQPLQDSFGGDRLRGLLFEPRRAADPGGHTQRHTPSSTTAEDPSCQ